MGNMMEPQETYRRPEGTPDGPGENLRVVLMRMIHDVTQQVVEDTTRSLEERILRRTEESWRAVNDRLGRLEFAVKELEEKGEKKMKRLEDSLVDLEQQRRSSCCDVNMDGSYRSQAEAELLEQRVVSLEQSVERALQSVLPRVETLLHQLDHPTTPPPPPPLQPTPPPIQQPPSTARVSQSKVWTSQVHSALILDMNGPFPKPGPLEEALKVNVQTGNIDDVRKVLDAGANINGIDDMGLTALHWAARRGDPDILSLLLVKGADIHVKDAYGWTPLHVATIADRRSCSNMLLSAGADAGCRDNNGWTPLHWAASEDSEAMVRTLLAANASTTVRDNFGMLPLDLAGSENMKKLLK